MINTLELTLVSLFLILMLYEFIKVAIFPSHKNESLMYRNIQKLFCLGVSAAVGYFLYFAVASGKYFPFYQEGYDFSAGALVLFWTVSAWSINKHLTYVCPFLTHEGKKGLQWFLAGMFSVVVMVVGFLILMT